ncbi:MAG: metal-dependent transcriptional regulator [Clostridia bacterium]|nr:metal-dependent transcriptional regulator [Clostridia bacterium]
MNIHESGEMYLENIYVLSQQMSGVRSIDIVNHTGYSKPSISRAIGLLKDEGLILVDKKGYITLTEQGEARAIKIYERHELLTEFFTRIGVPEEIASADACKIEHVISDETFEAIKKHANMN